MTGLSTTSRYENRAGRQRRGGMTLIELMVAVGVMAVMIAGFGTILSQSQRLVVAAQAKMRADSAAAGIEQVIRRDLLRVSQNGFISVGAAGGSPALVLLTVGVSESLIGKRSGSASIVVYGLCDNSITGATGKVFFRKAWVLNDDVSGGKEIDQWDKDMGQIQVMSQGEMESIKASAISQAPASLKFPAEKIAEIGDLWQVLAGNCTSLSIEYASASPGGALAWSSAAKTWTRHNQNNWPAAIKVKFVLTDPSLPAEFQNRPYEVICPGPR